MSGKTMLYKYPCEAFKNNVDVKLPNNEKAETFEYIVIPSDKVSRYLADGWSESPEEAYNPDKKNERSEISNGSVAFGEGGIDIQISEIESIKGPGSKQRLIEHAAKNGIELERKPNFKAMKKDYLEKLNDYLE
jgi:hypothetical protein